MNNWEVSLKEFKENNELKYKVTRRFPEYSIAETKIFSSKEKAMEQLNEWLQ
jgi:hypothetical protein